MDDAGDFDKLRASNAEAAGDSPLPHGFRLTAEGVFFVPDKSDAPRLHVCGPLRVVAATHDASGSHLTFESRRFGGSLPLRSDSRGHQA